MNDRALEVLTDFWAAYEIAGVARVEIDLGHWLYDPPDATPTQLREAAVSTARIAWTRWSAPVFGTPSYFRWAQDDVMGSTP